MDKNGLIELQDSAYCHILEEIADAKDSEKIQQLANAAAQLEKGRNDARKIENDILANQDKLENDKRNREEDLKIAEKQGKFDKAIKIFDGVVAVIGCAAGIVLAFKTKNEEEDSYPKQPKTDMKADRLFERAWKRKN